MNSDRDRIIVLRKTPYKDADLIIRGLNTQGAKVSYLAPSALKSRRRFGGGVLEPLNFIEVQIQKTGKSNSSLLRLQEAQVIKEFVGLRRSYEVIQLSLSFLSLIDHLGQEGDIQGQELFNLLGHTLQYLSQNDIVSLPNFRLHFITKVLFQQGVLQLEDWMTPYLQTPMASHNLLIDKNCHHLTSNHTEHENREIINRLILIEQKARTYLETGGT